ncbi:MAG: chromosomal replication initiator protein DnaA [Desulfobacteraceae bacterium]|nr:MAG: chromosomal replication initiator protein DnaA [Desulfobacteraceae bacterium]
MDNVWESLKEALRSKVPEKSYSLWIKPITLLEQKDSTLLLGCPNKFSMNWVMDNYGELMEERLREISAGSCTFRLKVMPAPKNVPKQPLKEEPQLVLPHVPVTKKKGWRTLNNDFTFDRFVVGKCNEFAYSASKALALESKFRYNPLFLLANTGLGKSHLSQAVGHALLQNKPDLRVYYITAEDFVNEMIWALKSNSIEEFKSKYRKSCDALLLEEVHFLSGKEKTQVELGYTLDALADDHKKIIFTSSVLPKDIPNLSKELYSRFNSGLIATMDTPDHDTRLKILEKKASEQDLHLSEEIIHLLAEKLTGDIRQMESALRCLKAKSELLKAKIDLHLVKEVLQCHVSAEGGATKEDIRALVCQYFKIDPSVLQSKSRKAAHSYPRNVYVYLCRRHTSMTLEEIGQSINRNHSTIVYACEVIERKMKGDAKVKNQISFLGQRLRGIQA